MLVYLNIKDVNDNEPQFDHQTYSGQVPEDADIGASVLTVQATDTDSGEQELLCWAQWCSRKLQEVKCLNGEGIVVLVLLWMIFIICTKNISLIIDNAGHNRYMNLLHVHEIIYEPKQNNTVIHTFLKRLQSYYYFIIFLSWI